LQLRAVALGSRARFAAPGGETND